MKTVGGQILRKQVFNSHRHYLMPRSGTNTFNRISSINSHLSNPQQRAMSSAGIVELSPQTPGQFHVPEITQESSKLASQLLQQNHDKFHMYFNASGFHNHIAHHLLAAFALGATPPQLQHDYDVNASYQRMQFPVEQRNVQSMSDPAKFKEFLNNEKYFHDYEMFFQQEIDAANGNWGEVLHKYLFSKTEHANDLLARMYAGFYHPIIHLGYGIEFRQPAIIAEALAQASTHDAWMAGFLNTAEKKAREAAKQDGKSTKSLVQILKEARANDTIRNSAQSKDGNKVRDGVLKRAADETSSLVAQWRVNDPNDPVELRRKTAEMINACALFAGAAQHPSHKKQIKFDFFYMHCLNCSLFYSAFLDKANDNWLSNPDRARLLEYKGWSDVALYVSRGAPELFLDEITHYQAKQPKDGWAEVFLRACKIADDGHSIKLVRAIGNGHQVCTPLEGELDESVLPIRGDMWLKLAHMAIDSVEGAETRWIRNAGFDEAWKDIPDRKDGFPDGHAPGHEEGEHYHETH